MQHPQLLFLGSVSDIISGLFGLVFGLLYLAFLVGLFVGMWKVFVKAGKPGWACLIPIYNIIVLHEIVGREPIKILLFLIPLVNIYFAITLYVSLAKSFGKRETVEYMLSVFFWPFYLGLTNAQYVGPSEGPQATAGSNVVSSPTY